MAQLYMFSLSQRTVISARYVDRQMHVRACYDLVDVQMLDNIVNSM